MKVFALTLISSLALGGCGLQQSVRDNMTEGRYQDVAGRFLELKQPLPVEVDRARVFSRMVKSGAQALSTSTARNATWSWTRSRYRLGRSSRIPSGSIGYNVRSNRSS